MLNLADTVAVYHLGLDIGYFKLSDVITWADNTILELDISKIPFEIYEVSLSKNKKRRRYRYFKRINRRK